MAVTKPGNSVVKAMPLEIAHSRFSDEFLQMLHAHEASKIERQNAALRARRRAADQALEAAAGGPDDSSRRSSLAVDSVPSTPISSPDRSRAPTPTALSARSSFTADQDSPSLSYGRPSRMQHMPSLYSADPNSPSSETESRNLEYESSDVEAELGIADDIIKVDEFVEKKAGLKRRTPD